MIWMGNILDHGDQKDRINRSLSIPGVLLRATTQTFTLLTGVMTG